MLSGQTCIVRPVVTVHRLIYILFYPFMALRFKCCPSYILQGSGSDWDQLHAMLDYLEFPVSFGLLSPQWGVTAGVTVGQCVSRLPLMSQRQLCLLATQAGSHSQLIRARLQAADLPTFITQLYFSLSGTVSSLLFPFSEAAFDIL